MSDPLVSVITPVFNGGDYFQKCIESVLDQSYHNWEYIIVNNCSTDQTLAIAQTYASRDRRIRIINNEYFLGIIENHNVGFSSLDSSAKYCKVLQADDWLFPQSLQKYLEIAEANPMVVLVGAYRMDGEQVGLRGLPSSQTTFRGREVGRAVLLGQVPDIFGSPTSHLFRAAVVRKRRPFYNPLNIHADTEACFDVLKDGDLGFVHEILSFTRRQGGTQTSKSQYMRSFYPGYLWILRNHGRYYLHEREYECFLAGHLLNYHQALARDMATFRKNLNYWRFHLKVSKMTGYPIHLTEILARIPGIIIERIKKKKA